MAACNPEGEPRAREGTSPNSLNYALLSQSKNMFGLWQESSQHVVNIQATCDVLQECFISLSENRKANHKPGMFFRFRKRLQKELYSSSVIVAAAFNSFFLFFRLRAHSFRHNRILFSFINSL